MGGVGRRGFLQRMASAAIALGAAGEIDYDKLLWVPGHRSFFLPSDAPIVIPDAQTIDRILTAHNPLGAGMPRYTLTIAGRGTFMFDEHWKLLSGREIGRDGVKTVVTAADIQRLERDVLGGVSFPPGRHWRYEEGAPETPRTSAHETGVWATPTQRARRWEMEPREIIAVGGTTPERVLVKDDVAAVLAEAVAALNTPPLMIEGD